MGGEQSPPNMPMNRFNHGELVYLMKKWPEFSIYEDGMPAGNYLHSSARYAKLKITTRAEPIQGERGNRQLMGTPQFIMITRKGEGH
jgi:hypothetical protein